MSGRRRPLVALALALLAGGAAGCGTVARVGSDRTLNVALSDYRVTPQDVEVSAGLLTISVTNFGRLSHNLVISSGSQVLDSSAPLAPGQSAILDVVLARGSYLMASSILSDQALGAYGSLHVG